MGARTKFNTGCWWLNELIDNAKHKFRKHDVAVQSLVSGGTELIWGIPGSRWNEARFMLWDDYLVVRGDNEAAMYRLGQLLTLTNLGEAMQDLHSFAHKREPQQQEWYAPKARSEFMAMPVSVRYFFAGVDCDNQDAWNERASEFDHQYIDAGLDVASCVVNTFVGVTMSLDKIRKRIERVKRRIKKQ